MPFNKITLPFALLWFCLQIPPPLQIARESFLLETFSNHFPLPLHQPDKVRRGPCHRCLLPPLLPSRRWARALCPAGPPCRLPRKGRFSAQPPPPGAVNLPAARRPCQRLRAVSSASWHPSGCAPTSIQGPRAGGATQRLAGRLASLQSKSPRVHARITQLAGFPLVPPQLRQGGKRGKERENLPVLREAAVRTPSPLP